MAVTVRGSLVSNQAGGSISGNMTITTPSATQVGDYLLLLLSCNKDTVTPAAGWTLLQNGSSATLQHQSLLYGRIATATDAGGHAYTWNLSNTTAAPDVAVMWAFGNVDTAHIVSAKGAEDTTSPVTTPGVTTTVPSLMVHLVADRRGSTPSLVWTFPSGTKTEGTNDGSVGYTASGAPATGTTSAGLQSGINITSTANPSTSFTYQVGLGDALTVVTGSDNNTSSLETSAIVATVPGTDASGLAADTAAVLVPTPVSDASGLTAESAKVVAYAGDAGFSTEATRVTSGTTIIAFASETVSATEATGPVNVSGDPDTGGAPDIYQSAFVGIEGPYPQGPRVVYVLPSTTG